MGIIEEQQKREEIKIIESLAQKLYNKQVKDITNISHTDWYKEIKAYWTRVKEWAAKELETVKEENLQIVQLKRKIILWKMWIL